MDVLARSLYSDPRMIIESGQQRDVLITVNLSLFFLRNGCKINRLGCLKECIDINKYDIVQEVIKVKLITWRLPIKYSFMTKIYQDSMAV